MATESFEVGDLVQGPFYNEGIIFRIERFCKRGKRGVVELVVVWKERPSSYGLCVGEKGFWLSRYLKRPNPMLVLAIEASLAPQESTHDG